MGGRVERCDTCGSLRIAYHLFIILVVHEPSSFASPSHVADRTNRLESIRPLIVLSSKTRFISLPQYQAFQPNQIVCDRIKSKKAGLPPRPAFQYFKKLAVFSYF
jgi:hypothetical protein